jgi:hypothetical protein
LLDPWKLTKHPMRLDFYHWINVNFYIFVMYSSNECTQHASECTRSTHINILYKILEVMYFMYIIIWMVHMFSLVWIWRNNQLRCLGITYGLKELWNNGDAYFVHLIWFCFVWKCYINEASTIQIFVIGPLRWHLLWEEGVLYKF